MHPRPGLVRVSRDVVLGLLVVVVLLPSIHAQPATDRDGPDDRGNTPLHLAALRSDAGTVETLLARRADANATNHAGATPLHYGIGDERILRALLAHGANPNAISKAGMTPLLSAVHRADSHAVVRLLVAAGADINVERSGDRNALLTQAIFGGDRRTVRFLLERGAKPAPSATRDGISSLEMATLVGDVDLVREFLASGVDVNLPSNFFGHSLNAAFYSNHPALAALFIERGADLKMKSRFGHGTPPIVWSAYNEHGESTLARLLLSHGVEVNATNDAGETALSFALRRGDDTPLVRTLRAKGAQEPAGMPRRKSPPARAIPAEPAERTALIRERTQRSLDLLQRASRAFLENGFVRNTARCASCHHQALPAVAFDLARQRGFRGDELELGRLLQAQIAMWAPRADAAFEMRDPVPDPPVSLGYGFDALAALRYQPDHITQAYIHYLIGAQLPDGSWVYFDHRPPMEGGRLVAVAWGIRAIQLYLPPGETRAAVEAIRRARDWLESQHPTTPEEKVFQLLGLVWAGATPDEVRSHATRLAAAQRSDGGWASLQTLASDAWATGTTLVALHKAGVPVTAPAYQRGLNFLLRTQFDDGSWWVRSRAWPFQPHFDSQFPHGKDQWISAGATAWATIALLHTLPPQSAAASAPTGQKLIAKFAASAGPPDTHAASPSLPATATTPQSVSFARDIWPILDRSCASCHAGDKLKGDFSIASRESLLKGGQSGEPAIVPGRSAASPLLAYIADKVEDLEMPPLNRREKNPPLTADEIALVRTWIDSGASWDKTP